MCKCVFGWCSIQSKELKRRPYWKAPSPWSAPESLAHIPSLNPFYDKIFIGKNRTPVKVTHIDSVLSQNAAEGIGMCAVPPCVPARRLKMIIHIG